MFRALPQGIGRRIVDKSVRAAFFPIPKMNAWKGMCLTSRSKQIEDSRPAPTQDNVVGRPAGRLTGDQRPPAERMRALYFQTGSPLALVCRRAVPTAVPAPNPLSSLDFRPHEGGAKRRFLCRPGDVLHNFSQGTSPTVQISRPLSDCMKFDRRGLGAGLWRSVPSSSRNRGLLGRFAASNAAAMRI